MWCGCGFSWKKPHHFYATFVFRLENKMELLVLSLSLLRESKPTFNSNLGEPTLNFHSNLGLKNPAGQSSFTIWLIHFRKIEKQSLHFDNRHMCIKFYSICVELTNNCPVGKGEPKHISHSLNGTAQNNPDWKYKTVCEFKLNVAMHSFEMSKCSSHSKLAGIYQNDLTNIFK